MKITDIYENYRIMPNLQEHQLRVAGVAKLICDNFAQDLDTNSIITACLLHDMGNIIKASFDTFPQFLEPQGLAYWQQVKDDFIKKYGSDETQATYLIIDELDTQKNIRDLIHAFGFPNAEDRYRDTDYAKKICGFSDMLVAPTGVTTFEQRMADAKKRYVYDRQKWTEENFDRLKAFWEKVEQQIFEKCSIKPEDINNETVKPLIEKLKDFEI